MSEWGECVAEKYSVLFVLLEEQNRGTWKMFWLKKSQWICRMKEVKLERDFKIYIRNREQESASCTELSDKIINLAGQKPVKQDEVGGLGRTDEIPKRGMDKGVEGTQ